jgi:small subunit ribosomal protein S6
MSVIVKILSAARSQAVRQIFHRGEVDVTNYELIVILRINDTLESNKEKARSILQKYGVEFNSEDHWGTRRLAYMIDGEKDGYYLNWNIQAPPDAVQKVITEYRLNGDILRYLFVKVKKKKVA